MQKVKSVKLCKYFVNGVSCPFDKYGCKFMHEKWKTQTEKSLELGKSNMNISRDIENGFQTSTPTYKRKILLCLGSCSANDLCANCIVKEMLQKGEINLEGSFCY